MSDLLTAPEAAEVDAYFNSPEVVAWGLEVVERWNKGPSAHSRYLTLLKAKLTARRNAASATRHAARLRRTPAWADRAAIRAVYAKARAMTEATSLPHHVDHYYPLQGRLVSGLHVAENLQVLIGSDNCRKNNKYEPS